MKKLLLFLIVGGAGFVLLAVMGYINVPGLTPASAPAPAESPEATDKAPAQKPIATGAPAPAAEPVSRDAEKKKDAPVSAPPRQKLPAIAASQVERARALYDHADFAGAAKALDGCDGADVDEGGATTDARALLRKARILGTLTQKFSRNKLVTSKQLERISLNSGGSMVGVVTEVGDRLQLYLMGNVQTEVSKDDVNERVPVGRDALSEKLHQRLKDKEARIKADDAFGNMRLGSFCWQYAMDQDAVPYLDAAVSSDDFPVLAKVFGGSAADKLVDSWCALTGKPRPGVATAAPPPLPTAEPVAQHDTSEPSPPPAPAASGGPSSLSAARSKYDQGVEKYKYSFGDSKEAQASLKAAHELFKAARDALGDAEDPASDDLRTQISRLIYDCSKRSAIN
jgi:hypothetical protein